MTLGASMGYRYRPILGNGKSVWSCWLIERPKSVVISAVEFSVYQMIPDLLKARPDFLVIGKQASGSNQRLLFPLFKMFF